MKTATTAIVLTLLFGAQHALAQSYYPTTAPYMQYSGSCVSISRDLSIGSRGTDVLALQRFILSRNYPGGGTWILTSYYGAATRAGVVNFQIDMHLPQTGVLDSMTRAALSRVTCGNAYNFTQPTYPTYPWNTQPWFNYGYNYNNSNNGNCGWYTVAGRNYFNDCGAYNPGGTIYPYNNYPYNYPYNYNGNNAPSISNVSGPTSLYVNTTGTWIISVNYPNNQVGSYATISVDWGDPVYGAYLAAPQQLTNISQQATFTHAYSQSGTYTVRFTVTNAYGSNTSSVTVQVNGNSYSSTPSISYITPTYGPIGTQITIYGSGFSGDNIVHFGNGGQAHVTSASGNYIYYTVPSSLTPCTVQVNGSTGCPQYAQQVTPGQYTVYVTSNGYNSNSATFTVQ